jgi:hypothetical protein
MGTSAVTLELTNRSGTPCWVSGFPDLRLEKSGHDLHLAVARSRTDAAGRAVTQARVGIAPGGDATASLWWKGYRQAADTTSPQTLVVRTGGQALRHELAGTSPRLDVVDGAAVSITPWGCPEGP